MKFTTVVITQDGKVHDLGKRQYVPRHDHSEDKISTCPKCKIVDAKTMPVSPQVNTVGLLFSSTPRSSSG